jgi:uncharacterized phage protein (TIGR02218 family)
MGFLLKFMPIGGTQFGLTSCNKDLVYDDGEGALTYRCAFGYTPFDSDQRSDLSVNNSQAASLIAQYPLDGVTMNAILRGDFDGCPFKQYLVNYENLLSGRHSIISTGTIGQISQVDQLACNIELRSLIQTLKQNTMVELTSVNCRAKFGDAQCKVLFEWWNAEVTSIGAEADRTFSVAITDSNGSRTFDSGFFVPGVAVWETGDNAGFEIEIEEFDSASVSQDVTLVFPVPTDITVGDTLRIRRDCAKSRAACIAYDNVVNFRGEPDLPVGNGLDAQAPGG